MKAQELIEEYDELYPNTRSMDIKMKWLKRIEQTIMNEVILTHEALEDEVAGAEDFDKETYFDDWGENKELLIDSPFTNVYITYLVAQEAQVNMEDDRFNTAATLHNNDYLAFQQYFNRTHKPVENPSAWLSHRRL